LSTSVENFCTGADTFGLDLNVEDRNALVAFLKTL
jgi:hypothetical protein